MRPHEHLWIAIALATSLAPSCALVRALGGDDSDAGGDGDDDDDIGQPDAATCALPTERLDLLVVIDRRATAPFMQGVVAETIPALLDALGAEGLTDLRAAVVSDEMNAPDSWGCTGDASFQTQSIGEGCAQTYGSVLEGNPAEIAEDLACLVTFAATTCELPQLLSAAVRGIDRASEGDPANDHFLRADTPLAILIVTDRDDCSIAADRFPERASESTQWEECFTEPTHLLRADEIVTGLLEHVDCPPDLRVQIIAGVPDLDECVLDQESGRRLLDHPDMEVVFSEGGLLPACQNGDPPRLALPANRLVGTAVALAAAGAHVGVQSICAHPDAVCAARVLLGR